MQRGVFETCSGSRTKRLHFRSKVFQLESSRSAANDNEAGIKETTVNRIANNLLGIGYVPLRDSHFRSTQVNSPIDEGSRERISQVVVAVS